MWVHKMSVKEKNLAYKGMWEPSLSGPGHLPGLFDKWLLPNLVVYLINQKVLANLLDVNY